MTQNEIILQHLRSHGSITSLEAIKEYGITRLSGRIYDCRMDGHNIKSENVKVWSRSGETTVAKYTLITRDQAELFEN